jgi:hypothetical protein
MTLEIKLYKKPAYKVRDVTKLAKIGMSFKIVISQTRYVEDIGDYEYIRDVDTGKYYVKDGMWCGNDT